jgi:tripartite-type tricarboxylate transporter receptor subunit TctC
MYRLVEYLGCGRRFRKVAALFALLASGLFLAGSSAAETFPSKPLRIVVPAAPGGNLDNVTRIVALKLSEQLGKPVIVDNRPGANYMVAVENLANSPPDGYTYLAIADSFLSAPLVTRTARFDPMKDFVGVSMIATVPQILVVNPSVPANSVKELIAFAKGHPGELSYGSAGVGYSAYMAAELFSAQAGIKMTHVPYKGNAPALIDVIGGRLSLMFDTVSTSIPQVKSGKLKALGVTSATRSPLLPNVPTVSESGLPGYEASIFNGIVARAGTPPEILARMNAELRKVIQRQDVRNRLLEQGVMPASSDSYEQFTAVMKSEGEKYAKVIKTADIHAN